MSTQTIVRSVLDTAPPQGTRRQSKRGVDQDEFGETESLYERSTSPRRHYRARKDYTAALICALPLELTAARAMLDEEHYPLTNPEGDENSYILGSMAGHDVVLVGLPKGIYGKVSAAVTATAMSCTFKSLTTILLVGIGGAAPRAGFDIRLGDVVVGVPTSDHPAVVQYDLGKTTSSGFHCRGNLNKPRTHLLSALSALESAHALGLSRIPRYMNEARRNMDYRYGYPGSTHDILRQLDCEHISEGTPCHCETFIEVQRAPRDSTAPVIFYGPIASGDQVIKDECTRNRLAKEHGVLCFEMEAAGLMDKLQALVIGGISDYCDVMKSSNFQFYAALAAAAFAKEFLQALPNTLWHTDENWTRLQEHRSSVMAAMEIGEDPSRVVNKPYRNTCDWILAHPFYNAWLGGIQHHTDLLWIKGKPGTGKSVMMKFLTDLGAQQQKTSKNLVTINFAFNKNGYEWESSTAGLYRSLCHQILSQVEHLQSLLDNFSANINANVDRLKQLFTNIVEALGTRHLICFIDALDECSEEQIRILLHNFEDIIRSAARHRRHIRILLSSRHYPGVYTNIGQSITMEDERGHLSGLQVYIDNKLRISKKIRKASDIDNKILQKSANVFLWVSLVVEILNREHDKGRVHTLAKRLDEMPPEMNDLFLDILTRDSERLGELVTCIQWILFAHRPLNCEELYFALLSTEADTSLSWDPSIISPEIMRNMILDCSKGLLEVTRSTKVKVQFIHETVRDFLTKSTRLQDIIPGFGGFSEHRDHAKLRDCCDRQIQYARAELEKDSGSFTQQFHSTDHDSALAFPFLKYAIAYILKHANCADKDTQIDTLKIFDIVLWARMYNRFWEEQDFQRQWEPVLTNSPWELKEKRDQWDTVLVKLDLKELVSVLWQLNLPSETVLLDLIDWFSTNKNIDGCEAMLKTFYTTTSVTTQDCLKHVRPLLTLLNNVYSVSEFSSLDPNWRNRFYRLVAYWHTGRTQDDLELAIYIASRAKDTASLGILLHARDPEGSWSWFAHVAFMTALIKPLSTHESQLCEDMSSCLSLLLKSGITVNADDPDNEPLLAIAIENAPVDIVCRLLEAGLECPSPRLSQQTALLMAIEYDTVETAQLLIARGVDRGNAVDLQQPLLHQVRSTQMAELLISQGALLGTLDDAGDTALHSAARFGRTAVITSLIDQGAVVNASNRFGYAPVHHAVADMRALQCLISVGADINARTNTGRTPLHVATHHDKPDAISLLLAKGAEVDAKDHKGNTCLHIAAENGLELATKVLLHYGASVDIRNGSGRFPILVTSDGLVPRILLEHGTKLVYPREIDKEYTNLLVELVKGLELLDVCLPCCEFAGRTTQEITMDIILRREFWRVDVPAN